MIVLPTDCMIHHKVVASVLSLILNGKHEFQTIVSAMQGIGEHRNVLVKDFLKSDCDYLLMIDADNPPPDNVLDLVDLNLEVVGLPTPINLSYVQGLTEIYWNVKKNGQWVKEKGFGLQEVESVGTGVMLIRRDVLEKLEHPFTTIRNEEDLRVVGTDVAFCNKCKEKGIKVWTHWDYTCRHFKNIDLSTLCY